MVTIRGATEILLLVLIVTVVAAPAAPAAEKTLGLDQGTIVWEKDTQYWPDELQARYAVDYPTVQISDISPGASNEFRLVIRNLTNSSLDFGVTVESSTSDKTFEALPKDWVDITSKASEKPGQAKPVTLVNVPAADVGTGETGIKQVWVHVSVPADSKWQKRTMQCAIMVAEATDNDGPECVLTVSTSAVGGGENQGGSFPWMWIGIGVGAVVLLAVGIMICVAIAIWILRAWKAEPTG